jgi:D-sorbitol dehydrogenase (acceptor)
MKRLVDKVALITGGASGIGAAIAQAMANEGARVCVADLSLEACELVSEKIGKGTRGYALDVTDQASIDATVAFVEQQFGQIDILVNSAGVFGMQPIVEITAQEFDRIVGINTRGLLFMTQAVIKSMLAAENGGSIVNIVSGAGRKATPGGAVYSLSKAAAISLTQSAAQEYAQSNIRVNAIAPGTTETPMWNHVREQYQGMYGVSPNDAITAATPAARLGTPADFVGAAIYLASDESSFMLGQTMSIDGGYFIG